MEIKIADWIFQVDLEKTKEHTVHNSQDHCTCSYCKNYYDTMPSTYPELVLFLESLGICVYGPSEVMPFLPTLVLACYRVSGEILQWGSDSFSVSDIMILPEAGENGTFLLWVGEMEIPWVQEEAMEDVISPANLPEFMDRMEKIWLLRHDKTQYIS